ncbi:transposon Ty3-G Gag-Pol polyprotein [Trichonephila clavipes]|nr:transposon Ty3-G Gag-Pol polyprotein [Trichonephila clavipes]
MHMAGKRSQQRIMATYTLPKEARRLFIRDRTTNISFLVTGSYVSLIPATVYQRRNDLNKPFLPLILPQLTYTIYRKLLKEFSSITKLPNPNQPVKHDTVHHIITKGPPVVAKPRSGVKSQDLGGQFAGPKREMRRSPNVSFNQSIVERAV